MKPLLVVALLILAASARAQIRTAPKLKAADSAKLLRLRTPAPATTQPAGGAKPVQPVMTGTILVPTTMVQAAPAPATPPAQNPPAPPPNPTTTPAPPPFVPTPELIRSYNWWRSINPFDFASYLSPYKLVPHVNFDTTLEKFAGKKSLSLVGWLYQEGWPHWRNDSLVHLRALKNLVQLQISPVFLNDSAFAFFGQMTNLKIIYHHSGAGYVVANPAVTDQGLAALLQNTSLEYLSLQNMSHITDAGFAHFRNMRNLKALYTAGWVRITDDAVLSLENCTALEELHFVSSNISDKGLANLLLIKDKLVNLKRLYVYQSKTTVAGVLSFQQNWGRPIDVRYL